MAEQRLIDANALKAIYEKWMSELSGMNPEHEDEGSAIHSCVCQLDDAPTIDSETLPIVRELRKQVQGLQSQLDNRDFWSMHRKDVLESAAQDRAAVNVMRKRCEKIIGELREKLAKVTAERDAAVKDLKRCAADLKDCAVENYMECNYCKNELEKYVSEICRNCKDGSNFEWRGPRKED